jgi:apolipoprotein N-acyltransferase
VSGWPWLVLGGALYGAGFYAPLVIPTFIAFVPAIYWLEQQPKEASYRRFQGGFVWGFVAALFGLHFCIAMLHFSWLAALLYLGFAAALAARISACLLLTTWLRRRTKISWGLLLPATWIPIDWLQTFGDLRMPGDHPAHALAQYPFLIQFADVVGHYGVSAFALTVNGLLYGALLAESKKERRKSAIALAALLTAVLGYDGWSWLREEPNQRTIKVALVQPNIPLEIKHGEGTDQMQRERLLELSRTAGESKPDLIVWPESARPDPLVHRLDAPQTYALPEVQGLAKELNAAFLVGLEYYRVRSKDDYDLYNAAIHVSKDGTIDPTWGAKVYLVPFVEATPFRRWLGPLVEGKSGNWRWLSGGFDPGPPNVVIDVDGARAGLIVCFEELFPDRTRMLRNAGAEFQVLMTNDAWYGRTPFQWYLANAIRLRAIENRTEFVRVANTGISGFVDRKGRFHERTGLFEQAVAAHDVAVGGEPTVYDRLGDVVVAIAGMILVGALWLARRGK